MAENKKLTIEKLIKNKDEITKEKKKTKELYVEELDGNVVIEKPDRALVMESIEIGEDDNKDDNGDEYMVYNVMKEPNLKSDELQKAYECKEPTDIVSALFNPGTVSSIAAQAIELAGYNSKVTPVDELKN